MPSLGGIMVDDSGSFARSYAALLNGSDVGYDLILLLGQSNMAGRGTVTDTRFDITDPRIFVYGNPAQTSNAYNSVIAQAAEFLLQHDGATGVGPGLPFARWYTTTIPANRRVLLVPCAHGGTPLIPTNQLSWNASIAAGANGLYQAALSTAQAALVQAGSNSRVVAALWHQGETDGDSSATGANYQTALDALIAQLRTDLALPTLPFVIGQLVPDYLATGTRQAINDKHVDTPRRLTRTGFGYGPAGSTYNNGDGNHYNAIGQRGPIAKPAISLGHSMFLAYLRALVNVTGTAPVTPAAPTLTQTSATALAVAWSQVLGRYTDWNVRYSTNGGTSWTAATRTVPNLDTTAALSGLTGAATVLVQVQSVNEQGTSAWSPSATLTLATAPNVITALTAGTATAFTQPLSWTAPAVDGTHSAATAYLVEYALTGSGSWTTAGTATVASYTVTGLTQGTAYDYRVTAQNVAGSAAAVTITNVSTAASTNFVSDSFTGTAGTTLPAHTGETGATWVQNTGLAGGTQLLLSNLGRLRLAATTQGACYASGAPGSADYTVEADFVFVSLGATDPTAWILGRMDTTAVTFYGVRYTVGTGFQLCKFVAGAGPTILATYNPTANVGDTHHVKLVMAGTTISMVIDGTTQGSATDSAISATGKAGVYIRHNTTAGSDSVGVHLDNLVAHP